MNDHPFMLSQEVERIAERLRDDRPNLYDSIECSWRDDLVDDWRSFTAEVRGSPYSHALVAIGAVVGWTLLIVAPLLLGAWSS